MEELHTEVRDVLARFNPRDQTFTFYPKPQCVGDSSKLQHAADGAVWYAPRYGAPAGASGFGHAFKVAPSAKASR